jgi:hypothetical protein
MRTILVTTSAVALVATMSLALAQTSKGEQGQKEMSAPAMKGGGEKDALKAGEKSSAADKKGAQEKGAQDSPKAKDDRKQAADKASKDTAKDEKGGKNAASKEAAGKDGKADAKGGSGSVTLSQEQRTKVQGSFAKHKGQSANVNITVNVGVAVPRTVELRAIPQDIIVIVPAYRRYRYFVVGDKVCIVDPDTYQIVEIIVIA